MEEISSPKIHINVAEHSVESKIIYCPSRNFRYNQQTLQIPQSRKHQEW